MLICWLVCVPLSLLQALLPDLASYGAQPLYATIKATTDCGDVVVSTSNGFVIDPSPPTLEVISTGENAVERAQSVYGSSSVNHTTYQTSRSSSAVWQLGDEQSDTQTGAVVRIGSYPGGGNIVGETVVEGGNIRGSLEAVEGLPQYVTVTGTNRARLSTIASGRAVVMDTSPPSFGQVCISIFDTLLGTLYHSSPSLSASLSFSASLQLICSVTGFPPPLPLPPSSPSATPSVVECQWSNITDPHSGVSDFTLAISQGGLLIFNTTLPGIYHPLKHPVYKKIIYSIHAIIHWLTLLLFFQNLFHSQIKCFSLCRSSNWCKDSITQPQC